LHLTNEKQYDILNFGRGRSKSSLRHLALTELNKG